MSWYCMTHIAVSLLKEQVATGPVLPVLTADILRVRMHVLRMTVHEIEMTKKTCGSFPYIVKALQMIAATERELQQSDTSSISAESRQSMMSHLDALSYALWEDRMDAVRSILDILETHVIS